MLVLFNDDKEDKAKRRRCNMLVRGNSSCVRSKNTIGQRTRLMNPYGLYSNSGGERSPIPFHLRRHDFLSCFFFFVSAKAEDNGLFL